MGYGSGKARHWAAAATALITATAYHTSTEMAEAKGSFAAFEENKNSMTQVIGMHMEALDGIVPDAGNRAMLYLASQTWQLAETGGRFYGFRNAQVTCIAPTGTISLLMDSETTGMEPYYSFDTRKTFSTGKQLRLDFPLAWKKLVSKTPEKVYEGKTEIRTAEELSCIHKYADVDEEIGALFTAAMPCPICNHEGLHVNMHIDMIAAIQPFVSGGISKTVNVPHHATQKDISACLLRAFYSGLKSISVYRDGCKATQPLQQGDCCSI
jgi:ribonucleoside-diphosphate reductase alpha chain